MSNKKIVAKLTFIDGKNTKKTITVKNPIEPLSKEVAEQAMDAIIAADVFSVKGVKPYVARDSAKIVETTEEMIFDVDEEPTEA